ncbi:MAG: lamin tail domain-containing protein, partial [Flavobacterium sp.]|nr:lamin tail domain-containing protein [Flavobacterium sp.]
MKIITFSKNILFVTLALFAFQGFSQNLLNNGNFEAGGIVGFNINGAGYTQIFPPFSGTTSSGNFAITTNPQPMNTASFITTGDHTSGTGNMMIIDGNTTGGQQNFWEAGNGGGGVCSLTIGATYTFSYWIRSVYGAVGGSPTPANIGTQILNATSVTLVSGSAVAPLTAAGWQQVVYTFVPTGTCVNIKLYNNNTNADGNDFAVDDFSVTAAPLALSVSYSASNPSCPNTASGSIVASGNDGAPPYTTYNLSGTVTQTNATGIFSGLSAGTYSVTVIDSNGNSASQTNIVLVDPAGLTTSPASSICSGSSTTLTVSGSSSGYTWTASPADSSLTTPNISNPVVSPTQATTYTVTSTTSSTINLIANGNFSSGNIGFVSDYTYYSPANTTFAQRAYGIVVNPNTWEPGFSALCVDHTTGSGPMMVVDGSIYNGGNDLVWGQNIVVNPGQNYTFSYWLQTVAASNPAVIRTLINGVLMGTANASATVCGWTQYTYVWNSGASTLAQIQLFDSNVNTGGNDFALDDFSFASTVSCNLSASVTVSITTPLTPTIVCGTSTPTSQVFNWGAVTGATNYTVAYSVNGGAFVNAGNITATTFTVTPITSTDVVSLTVTPNGSGCLASATQTCGLTPCPPPTVSVTQQPTCPVPTGTIVFTSPINPAPLPLPSDLFISEVTDEDVGSLTYIEIFNGTSTPKNLANYKLKIYNNGNAFTSCEFALSGTLNANSVYVISVGSITNQGGVVPNLVVSTCAGINNNDNIRLTTSTDVEIDLWGRTDGAVFTPANLPGYTYRRLATASHPSLVWNTADWTTIDPQNYTNVGAYTYQAANYVYSVNGTTYQSSPTFTGLIPGTYNVTVRDLVSGCTSTPIPLVVNPLPVVTAPNVVPVTYCQNSAAVPLTATAVVGGTLNWYGTNATGGTASATAPTPVTTTLGTTTYYVSQTVSGCESPRAAITVTVSNQTPTATPFLFCDTPNSTATSVAFDFNNVGQTSFSFSYTIDGGTPVTGTFPTFNGSNYTVTGVLPGQVVVFTIIWNGVCTPPLTSSTVVPTFNQRGPYCSGQTIPALPTTSLNG